MLSLALPVLLVASACTGSTGEDPEPSADAGQSPDVAVDAGAGEVDAGTQPDAGAGEVDAGSGNEDAGSEVDAGPGEVDAGAGEVDAGTGEVDAGAPEPANCDGVAVSDVCLAVACENDDGLGRPCTKDGDECDGLGLLIVCSADFADNPPLAFCTKPCGFGCGDGMVCESDPDNPILGSGCVPEACID